MKCPLCNTEMRIKSSEYVKNKGELFNRMVFTCRNKKCKNYQKDVKTTYTPLKVVEDSNAEDKEVEGA
mgnify:CR=1 FL=1